MSYRYNVFQHQSYYQIQLLFINVPYFPLTLSPHSSLPSWQTHVLSLFVVLWFSFSLCYFSLQFGYIAHYSSMYLSTFFSFPLTSEKEINQHILYYLLYSLIRQWHTLFFTEISSESYHFVQVLAGELWRIACATWITLWLE